MDLAIIDAATGENGGAPDRSGGSRYSTPIANLPLIYHVLDELAGSGINRARIVAVEAVVRELEHEVGGGESWEMRISYATAVEGNGRCAVLHEIETALESGPVLLYPGDCLFPNHVAAMRERYDRGGVDVVLLGPGSVALRGLDGSAIPLAARITDTPVVLGREARGVVAGMLAADRDGQDLVERLLASDCRTVACELAGHWTYSDGTADLLTANRMILDALPVPAVDGVFEEHNEVHGRVAISPSARVSGCTINGPVTIDDGAVVEDSFIGPYTAIGAGAVIRGTEIDNAMVLRDAEVQHPGSRIEASIIGERASVTRSFELPKGLHLRLGPGSRITLS